VAFSPDGRRALSGSAGTGFKDHPEGDKTVRLWDVLSRQERLRIDVDSDVKALAFLDDRRAVFGHEDGTIRIWDLQTGREIRRFQEQGHTGRVSSVALSSDCRRLLSGGLDGTVRLWDVADGRELRRFPFSGNWICGVALSPDGRLALSAGFDKMVRLYDLTTAQVLRRFQHDGPVNEVAFSGDRLAVSASSDGTVRVWDVVKGSQVHELRGHKSEVLSLAVTRDGRRALSGGTDGVVTLWDLENGRKMPQFVAEHERWVSSVAFSPDGRLALSSDFGKKGGLRLWRLPAVDIGP
jgi:WD40 repeat protein